MLIKTDRRIYKVLWRTVGYSYAEPCVAVKSKVLFGLFTRWKEVWSEPSRKYWEAKGATFEEIRAWFVEAVRQYERYEDSWGKAPKIVDLQTKPDPVKSNRTVKPNQAAKSKPIQELRLNKDGVYEAE